MFEGNQKNGFQNMLVFSFCVLYCTCQNIDKVNEGNWQNMLIDMNFWQYFANIL